MPSRSLLPREHGAYFQLAMPLVGAFLTHSPTLAGAGIAIAACCAFLAHEPASIALGGRGKRLRASEGARARVRLALLAIAGIAAGVGGMALAPATAIAVALPVLAVGAAVMALAARRVEQTPAGELVAVVALTGASAVVVVANGATLAAAARHWLGWSVGFGATILAVHRVLVRHKHRATTGDHVLAGALGIVAIIALATIADPVSAIVAPMATIATVLVVAPPRATRLRAVGVAIAFAAGVSLLLGTVA